MKLIEYLKKEDEYKNIYWAEDVKRIVEVMKKKRYRSYTNRSRRYMGFI